MFYNYFVEPHSTLMNIIRLRCSWPMFWTINRQETTHDQHMV